jgi:hypothetical protein
MRRFFDKAVGAIKIAGMAIFKVWILVMLVGYFVVFMLIALAALCLSFAGNNSDNRRSDSGGGLSLASNLVGMIFRIWFYTEMTKSFDPYYRGSRQQKPKGRPLHKAVFSFVFGDGDPNADMVSREKQAVIAYVQANKGILSLPEFMMLTGKNSLEAEKSITEYCLEFGGLPEATDDGTVIYRFNDLLRRAEKNGSSQSLSAPLKHLKIFSTNKSGMNTTFAFINGVNVLFGSYFLYNAIAIGVPQVQVKAQNASFLYNVAYSLFEKMLAIPNPQPVLFVGLGVVPIAFSVLFWLIPAIRYGLLKKENEKIKFENFRKYSYVNIWNDPLEVTVNSLDIAAKEALPENTTSAKNKVIKEIGAYSMPEVTVDNKGETVYSFKELDMEKSALIKARKEVSSNEGDLGGIVFES